MDIRTLAADFANRLQAIVEIDAIERLKADILQALGINPRRGPGRPRMVRAAKFAVSQPRMKTPIQLCPVPYCRNPAAPIFGMVCAKHKDVPKAKIKKYREARRAKKAKAVA